MSSNLDNCPITILDVDNIRKCFGSILGGARGKTTRKNPENVTTDYVAIPKYYLAFHKYVTLVEHVMFVNNTPFQISMSRGIKIVTVEHIPSRTTKQLSKNLKIIMDFYSRGSVIVLTVLMKTEFDSTKDEAMGKTFVNTSAAK